MSQHPFRRFRTTRQIIQFGVRMFFRSPLSLRNFDDLLRGHGIDVCPEGIRLRVDGVGADFANNIRRVNNRGENSRPLSKTRKCAFTPSANSRFAEVRLSKFVSTRPFRSRKASLLSINLQSQSKHRASRTMRPPRCLAPVRRVHCPERAVPVMMRTCGLKSL
jgi:hypothetical protein